MILRVSLIAHFVAEFVQLYRLIIYMVLLIDSEFRSSIVSC